MSVKSIIANKLIAIKKPSDKDLDEVKKLIEEASDIYYNGEDVSFLTDEEFDALLKYYRKFRPHVDGAEPKFSKRKTDHAHNHSLQGNLDKANTIDEVREFFLKCKLPKKFSVGVSLKIDGNSVIIEGENEKVKRALTRGKNGKGMDVTDLFKNRRFPIKGKFAIKTEAATTFKRLETISEIKGKTYVNTRSVIAGLLSSKDGYLCKDEIILVPLRVTIDGKEMQREEEYDLISEIQSKEIPFTKHIFIGSLEENIKEIEKIYKIYTERRNNLDYLIDGLVIEILDVKERERLGRDEDNFINKFEIALKFPYNIKRSTVEGIKFYFSKKQTGIVTPVVVFKPVVFSGNTCSHVSIANYKRFKELQLAEGDEIIVQYRNDTLAYIEKDFESSKSNKNKPIKFPKTCPSCGEKLVINDNETFVSCENKKCHGRKIGKVVNYLTKMDIKGVRENMVDKMFEAGVVKNIMSLYKLTPSKLMQVDGFQELTVKNIINAINSRREVFDYEVLGSLGFKGFGRTKAKELLKVIDFNRLMDMFAARPQKLKSEIMSIHGFEETTADHILKGLKSNEKTIRFLMNELKIKSFKSEVEEAIKNSTGERYSIVVTGDLDCAPRDVVKNRLEALGHKMVGSVSGKTNFLIVGRVPGNNKIADAKKHGTPIKDEKWLIDEIFGGKF